MGYPKGEQAIQHRWIKREVQLRGIEQHSLAWENMQADIRKYFYRSTQLTVSFLIPRRSILHAEGNSPPERSMLSKMKPSSFTSTDRENINEKEEI